MSEAPKHGSLTEALVAFQAEAPTLPKPATNPHYRSKFTPLDVIVEQTRGLLAKHGLAWSALPTFGPNGEPALKYRLWHVTGGAIEDTMPLLVPKQDPQGLGSALTYCRRYSMCAVLNLVSDDDDDGHAASQRPAKAAAPKLNGVKFASPEDLKSMAAAARGLTAEQVKLAVGACGVQNAKSLAQVPADKAVAVTKALAAAPREAAA